MATVTSTLTTTIITTILSSITAVAVTLLVNVSAIRREREAEWRKLKLDRYQEFIAALSEVVGSRSTAGRERKERYANAVNSLILVASDAARGAIYRYQDETSISGKQLLLKTRVDEIRKDISARTEATDLAYRLFDAPIE